MVFFNAEKLRLKNHMLANLNSAANGLAMIYSMYGSLFDERGVEALDLHIDAMLALRNKAAQELGFPHVKKV